MWRFKIVKQPRFGALFLVFACLWAVACQNPADTGSGPADTGGLAVRDIGNGSLTLDWSAVPEAEGYRLYYSEGAANPQDARIIDILSTDTTYTLEDLSNGAAYYFWIRGVKDGLETSPFKAPLRVTIPVPPPDAAGIMLARDETSIHVLWEPVSGAVSYEAWYSITNRSASAKKWDRPVEGTRVEVTGLLPNNTYYFWLKSVGTGGPSAFSGVKSETTGTPLNPAIPVIRWTGRLRNAIFVNWKPSANATAYDFCYSAGNDVDQAEGRIPDVKTTVCMVEGLSKGISYNFWVRSRNPLFVSEWSDMGTVTPGLWLPAQMEGKYFSRYPYDRPYYMDGYWIGPVFEMSSVFPFNKAKYPNPEYRGFPGPLAERGILKEGAAGGVINEDDQYVYYVGGWLGVVRAILERTEALESGLNRYINYTVIELFKIPGLTTGRYEKVEFRYHEEQPGILYPGFLMGINGVGSEVSSLSMEDLHKLSGTSWDAGVAYPGIRLGYGSGDTDALFHPELIRPEPIWQYLAEKLPELDRNAAYSYFLRWNEEKGMYNWQDREQFPAEELMEYVLW
jgi:hypothetical protein